LSGRKAARLSSKDRISLLMPGLSFASWAAPRCAVSILVDRGLNIVAYASPRLAPDATSIQKKTSSGVN
jgi:hypothetical protein